MFGFGWFKSKSDRIEAVGEFFVNIFKQNAWYHKKSKQYEEQQKRTPDRSPQGKNLTGETEINVRKGNVHVNNIVVMDGQQKNLKAPEERKQVYDFIQSLVEEEKKHQSRSRNRSQGRER